MCLLKNFEDVTHNRTFLFMIVLLSLKLCSPQDLSEEFANEDSVDSTDTSMVAVKRVKFPRDVGTGPCRLSELLCDTGQCISLDKYCNGEDDCGDKSDEPKACTPCNRTYMGDVGRTYEIEVRRPREDHLPFVCHLNFTATGGNYGDIIQLTFDTFTVGKFVSFTSDGCPDGHMTIVERSPSPPLGQWCGSAWGYTVYFSESDSINMTLRLDRLSQQGVGYNFDFKLAYKFLRRSEARLRYGNATVGAWRGERVPGTYCDRILSDCDLRACRIQSPNFPGVYPRNATCTYRIEHTKTTVVMYIDIKLAYKFLRRSEARLLYINATVGAWRGERVPGTYCDRILSDCDLRACRIQSPNFPGVYPRNATCTYRIEHTKTTVVMYIDIKLAYKFLRRSEARLRYGNATVGAWRGERVPGTYCDRILSDCDLRACRIQSPNFPGVYPRNATCTYRIEHTKTEQSASAVRQRNRRRLARRASARAYCDRIMRDCDQRACRIQSPNFPGVYPKNVTCKYCIEHTKIPADKHVLLAVRQTNSHKIHIKDQIVKYDRSQRVLKIWDQCNVVQDYLTVWDGATRDSPVLVRLCGGDAVPDIISRGPNMLLEFHTSPYDNPFHPVPLSYLPGFELEVQVLYVDKDSHSYVRSDGRCRFVLRSSDKTSGVLRNPRHSLPPNTSCVYYFQGRPNEIVWVSFVKYHSAGTEPAGFDQQKDCSSQLTIWDGAAPDADLDRKLEMTDKKSLLGSFCREESPRLCDHALLSNATRATRPCAPSESYITTGPALTILQELRQGSALYPVSFLLRYEFVDVSEQGQPLVDSRSACDRVFKSAQTYSGRFQAPRAIFYYGRGGAQNLTCILRFEAKQGERVQLTFTSTYFGNKHCNTHKDSRTGRWKCDRPVKRTIGGEGLAQIIITEYPWEGVPIQRDCFCTNRTEPLNVHTLTAPVVELNFTVTMMNITEDYDDFAFEGEYKFVPTGPGDETVCSSGWGKRQLRGSSGEIRLFDKRHTSIAPEIVGDRNVISESVRAEVACVHRPWLVEPGGDDVTPVQGRYLYIRIPGYEMTTTSPFCPTPNRLFLYEARDTSFYREVCPDGPNTIELFSPGWLSAQTPLESSLKPHARSYVIDFLQHEQADYSIKWIELMKKTSFEHDPENNFLPAAISLECRYSCPELNACIPLTLWCDGSAHCPSGYDEDDSNCSFRISLPPPYVAAAAGAGLLLCAVLVALCACRRRRKKDKEFKARLDGALPPEERPYDRAKTNGVPEATRQYATVQKYATIDKYSLSQKYSAGLNDARYYDEVAQRDKLADTRYASLGRGGRGMRVDNLTSQRGNGSRRAMPDLGYPDLKDGFC